jgi:dipeptidyl aminopeptidase/acylaminoacyl peptidase
VTDRNLADWTMVDGLIERTGTRTPDYADDAIAMTARVRQRPAWTFVGRWWTTGAWSPLVRLGVVVAMLVLAMLAGLLVWAAAQPAPRPRLTGNGPIAVTRCGLEPPGMEVVLVDPATGRVLADGPTWPGSAVGFSPDSMRLAYLVPEYEGRATCRPADRGRLWVSRSDGTGAVPITGVMNLVSAASWSSDGTRLAVSFTDENGQARIGIAATDGSGMRVLDLGGPVDRAAWQPQGNRILFRRYMNPYFGILTVSADDPSDSQQVAVLDHPQNVRGVEPEAAWSPDGRQIVYVKHVPGDPSRVALHVVGADGSGDRVLPVTSSPDHVIGPKWSPDGRWIAALAQQPVADMAPRQPYLVAADGSLARPIGPTQVDYLEGYADLEWSPDGRVIAAGTHYTRVSDGPDSSSFEDPRIVLIDADAGSWTDAEPDTGIFFGVSTGTLAWQAMVP